MSNLGATTHRHTEPLDGTVSEIVRLVASVATGLGDVSVVLLPEGGHRLAGSTAAGTVEALQHRERAGPLLDALAQGGLVHVSDTSRETRYPAWVREAGRLGITASVSVCLHGRDGPTGTLNLYSRSGPPFDDIALALVDSLAEHASVMLAQAAELARKTEEVEQLHEAMASRSTIEQAKGMLVATRGCSPDEAFALLRRASGRSNRKIRHLADEMVRRGLPPGRPAPPRR